MTNFVSYKGRIIVDPITLSKKHKEQSVYRRVAMITFGDDYDLASYYAWFIKKRFGVKLLKPLREPHVTFLNKPIEYIIGESDEDKEKTFLTFKERYNGTEIDVLLDLNMKGNNNHIWLNVEQSSREEILKLTNQVTLEKPKMGWHMTIGRYHENDLLIGENIKNSLYGCE